MWHQDETHEDIYKAVERHSPGMISFAYQPAPSEEVLEALKDTETFKASQPANAEAVVTPA